MGCGASRTATAVASPGGVEKLHLIAASYDLKSDYSMLEEIGSGEGNTTGIDAIALKVPVSGTMTSPSQE